MNFATLPPEINSGRMCAGPGSESMTEAAAAWDKLAARLYARLADYRSVTSKLAATEVTAMTQAAAPYIDWLDATAARAAHAATQAETAASAFESALAAVVPLPVDRSQPRTADFAGLDELPRPTQPGDRGHRSRI